MKERKIAWERWVDEVIDDSDHLDVEDESEDIPDLQMLELPMQVRTPIGIYGQTETMSPSNMFDCWFCHTNFDLTEADKHALDMVDGVEVLRIVSRYRFFIGIGKMFSLTDVRPLVEMALNVNQHSIISQIISEISGKKKWAIGVYEDGSYRSITSDSDKDESYDTKLEDLRTSGVINILTSDEV
jgi:hypothetical protein